MVYVTSSNKCIASSNKCLTSSNKKLVETIEATSSYLLWYMYGDVPKPAATRLSSLSSFLAHHLLKRATPNPII